MTTLRRALLGVCLLSAGCGGGSSDAPPLARVKGVVTLDQKPLTRGSIQFIPDGTKGTKGRMALGEIGPDGSFSLMTLKPGDGAQIGFHKVVIQSYDAPAFDPNNPKQAPVAKSLIPEVYADPTTSKLTAEVKKGDENQIPFDLKSKP